MALFRRIANLFLRPSIDQDIQDELHAHIEMRIEDSVAAGMSPLAARRDALLKFGNPTVMQERVTRMDTMLGLDTFFRDVRYGGRMLWRSKGFTAVAVGSLALGIGASTAIFSLIHAVLLRDLPVSDPKSLIRFGDKDDCCVSSHRPDEGDFALFSYEMYKALGADSSEFEHLTAIQAGIAPGNLIVRGAEPGAVPKVQTGEFISGSYFQTLGINPSLGRLLQPTDDNEGSTPVAVMSYATWKRQFAANPAIVGSVFVTNSQPVTIVGIAPESFYGDRLSSDPPGLYLPLSIEPILESSSILHSASTRWLYILGRLKPNIDQNKLQSRLNVALRHSLAQLDIYQSGTGRQELDKAHLVLTPGGSGFSKFKEHYSQSLMLLIIVSSLVLVIACANVANLLLVRGIARRAETSTRVALGATRARLLKQMLTESVLLACFGGLLGIGVSFAGVKILLSLAFPNSLDMPIHAYPSWPVIGFAVALSLATGIVFGTVPALLMSYSEPNKSLGGRQLSSTPGVLRLQRTLITLQIALSLVLLAGAGVLSKSLNALEHQNFGFETNNRIVVDISPDTIGYKPEQLPGLYARIEEGLHAIPGIGHVALSTYTPLSGGNWEEQVSMAERPGVSLESATVRVTPEYFQAIGQPLLRGRGFRESDIGASPAVVVNRGFVKKFFTQGQEPLGSHFGVYGVPSSGDFEIVGVVEDAKYTNAAEPARPMFFRPLLQIAHTNSIPDKETLYAGSIVLQTRGTVEGLESKMREILAAINPNLTVVDYKTLSGQVSGRFNQERMIARLTMLFSFMALVLGSVGLFGITAYSVAGRTAEIGVRAALGATRARLVLMVLREAMTFAGIGIALGLPIAIFCIQFLRSRFFGVAEFDIRIFAEAILILGFAAFAASVIPARRAASIDPVQALRGD